MPTVTGAMRYGISAGALLLAPFILAGPAPASRFRDVRGTLDVNDLVLSEDFSIFITVPPTRLEVYLPRAENLLDSDEIAFFRQTADVVHSSNPPPDIEDRSEWYTRLVWIGGLSGVAILHIRTTTTAHAVSDIQGVAGDLSRRPGDFYTDFTPTIQQVPGIEEAIRHIDETRDAIGGFPGGDIGLAQRWAAYLRGVVQAGSYPNPAGIDDAAWAWSAGIADCDGFANMFASGMRSLGIPACVMIGYNAPGGPYFDDFIVGGVEHGLHAWAGAWSEGLQAFVPVDINSFEYGLLDAQRVHFAYHEDLINHRSLVIAQGGSVSLARLDYPDIQESSAGVRYNQVRQRYVEDGYSSFFIANDVLGLHAPGGITGVVEPGPAEADLKLLVSSPFTHTLSVSVLTAAKTGITVEMFDSLGRLVAVPGPRREVDAGESFFRWLPGNAPSGVYFVRAMTDRGATRTRRAVLIR